MYIGIHSDAAQESWQHQYAQHFDLVMNDMSILYRYSFVFSDIKSINLFSKS